jgi:ABC-type polysaccharide/polyol phosphate export permease
MFAEAKKVWEFRELLVSLVQRDLKIRYKNSFLGFLWSMLNPLILVAVLTVVWKTGAGITAQNYSAYLLAAYLPYMFFTTAVMDATGSVLGNIGLVKKIYFPREILPLASLISNFIHFLLAMCVFFVYLLGLYIHNPKEIPFQITTIYLPILILINFFLAAGLGFLFSALNTFYEDVKYIVTFVMQILLFVSPILNFIDLNYYLLPRRYVVLNLLNPLGILCNGYRRILLAPYQWTYTDGPHKGQLAPIIGIQWGWIAYAAVISLAIFFGGYAVFNRYKWKFVERP